MRQTILFLSIKHPFKVVPKGQLQEGMKHIGRILYKLMGRNE